MSLFAFATSAGRLAAEHRSGVTVTTLAGSVAMVVGVAAVPQDASSMERIRMDGKIIRFIVGSLYVKKNRDGFKSVPIVSGVRIIC
jgi:hypothetical protein